MSGTTVLDQINTARRYLYSLHNGQYNRLAAAADADDTAFTFDFDLNGIVPGTTLSIGDELLYVWEASTSAKSATLQRAWDGSDAEAHVDASIVEVSPRFPKFTVRAALLEEIRSWGDAIYRTDTFSLSVTGNTLAYDLPIDPFHQITDVRRSTTATDGRWPRVNHYEVDRHADTSDFPSGVALYIRETLTTPLTLQITYTAPLDLDYFDDAADMEDDVGLAASMLDIAPLGAAWRLLAPREAKRTFTEAQGEPRLAEEVPSGATIRTAAGYKQLRDQRLIEESNRLVSKVALRW